MAEVHVVPCGPGWSGACTAHGVLPCVWASPTFAAYDALGHAAQHHAGASAS